MTELKKAQQLMDTSDLNEAGSLLANLQKKHPSQINILNLQGQVYLRQKKYKEAISCFEKSLRYSGRDAMINFFIALAYEGDEQRIKAVEACKRSIKLDPNFGLAYFNLARMLVKDGQQFIAIQYFKKALEFIHDNPEIYASLACSYNDMGFWHEALEYFAIATKYSDKREYVSSRFLVVHKDPNVTLSYLKDMTATYYDKVLSKIEIKREYDFSARINSPKTKLKVGFVSADFRSHPVGNYLVNVLEKLDKTKFEIFLYYSSLARDLVTDRLEKAASKLHVIMETSDYEVADLIYEDEVDILFDLSGYTGGERLGIVRLKPAPVQVAHLGYPGTLSIPEIDFIIADNVVVKEGEEQFFTETVYRLPGVFTHSAIFEIPDKVDEIPYHKNKFITFGSMNTFHKISDAVMRTWSEILKQVPNSILLFESQTLRTDCNKEYVIKLFEKFGIDKARLQFRSNNIRKEFLETYNDIDIALDSFPYTGGTSTIEACMMGVPVITIEGNTWAARMSATKLNATGHSELIVTNTNDYIEEYVKLANDIPRIENYRKTLRQDMENSKMNIDVYVKDFEKALTDMWQSRYSKHASQ